MDNFIPLESIRIANPCSADWDKMQGDDRARFCASCEKHVYNLSDMTRRDAENLVNEKEGRMCVQFYQRADGTMLTDNCPIPLRPARNGARWVWRGIGAGIAAIAAMLGGILVRADAKTRPVKAAHKTSHAQLTRIAGGPVIKVTKKSVTKKVPPPIALTGIVAPPARKTPPQKTKLIKPRAVPVHRPGRAPQMGIQEMGEAAPVRTLGVPAPVAKTTRGEVQVLRGDIGPSQ